MYRKLCFIIFLFVFIWGNIFLEYGAKKVGIKLRVKNKGKEGYKCSQKFYDALNVAIGDMHRNKYTDEVLIKRYSGIPYRDIVQTTAHEVSLLSTKWPKIHVSQIKKSRHEYEKLEEKIQILGAEKIREESKIEKVRNELRKFMYDIEDILDEILITGKIIIASFGSQIDGNTVGANWHQAGNYSLQNPTGFFPDYVAALFTSFNNAYNVNIAVEYMYHTTDPLSLVKEGKAHMTNVYFLQDAIDKNYNPLLEFHKTLPVVVSNNICHLRDNLNISTFSQLCDFIEKATEQCDRTVYFLTASNGRVLKSHLPSNAIIKIAENSVFNIVNKIKGGEAIAFVLTSRLEPLPTAIVEFNSRIDTKHGAWIKRSDNDLCISRYKSNLDN